MLCYTDTEEGDSPPIVATAASGYLRLRRTHYEDRELGDWAERIAARDFERAYVYFMQEDDALGTVFPRKLMELWKQRKPKRPKRHPRPGDPPASGLIRKGTAQ